MPEYTWLDQDARDALTSYAMEQARSEEALGAKWSAKWEIVRTRAAEIRRELIARRPLPYGFMFDDDEEVVHQEYNGDSDDSDSGNDSGAEPDVEGGGQLWVEVALDESDDDDDVEPW